MAGRPYTVLSCAMSLDGYLDTAAGTRLALSNEADFDRVDEVRANSDAILVGAATVRADNPRLLVRSERRRARRRSRGLPASPVKVTVTRAGPLDPGSAFFTAGHSEKLVYCATSAVARLRGRLGRLATVLDGGEPPDLHRVGHDLYGRGIRRLMVEGGGEMHSQFLEAGLADELQLVVAPLFVGDSRAHRFVRDGAYPWTADHRATLAEARQIGDVALLRYALSSRFDTDALPC